MTLRSRIEPDESMSEPSAFTTTMTVIAEKPTRPLSAYNLFFRDERVKLLQDRPVRPEGVPVRRGHGKMGFAEMARAVSAKWKNIDPAKKQEYEAQAQIEKLQYKKKLADWKRLLKKQEQAQKKNKKSKSHSVGAKANDKNKEGITTSTHETRSPNDSVPSSGMPVIPSVSPSSSFTSTGHSNMEYANAHIMPQNEASMGTLPWSSSAMPMPQQPQQLMYQDYQGQNNNKISAYDPAGAAVVGSNVTVSPSLGRLMNTARRYQTPPQYQCQHEQEEEPHWHPQQAFQPPHMLPNMLAAGTTTTTKTPTVQELAQQLDAESVEYFVNLFQC